MSGAARPWLTRWLRGKRLSPAGAAVPYVLTLVILVLSCRPGSVARGSPGELSSVH